MFIYQDIVSSADLLTGPSFSLDACYEMEEMLPCYKDISRYGQKLHVIPQISEFNLNGKLLRVEVKKEV